MEAFAGGVGGTSGVSAALLLIIGEIGSYASGAPSLLRRAGFHVMHAPTGCTAAALVRRHRPDVVVLDVGRSNETDLTVLGDVHREGAVPVIVLAAKDQADPVTGLEMGADDFMVKPIALMELAARARAAVRRASSHRRV